MLTYEELQPWCPLTPDQFFTATDGRKEITPLEICKLAIPAEDRIRVLIRSGCMEQDKLDRAVGRIVDRAVKTHCLNCGITDVEQWAEKWLSGADRTITAAYATATAVAAAVAAVAAADAADDAAAYAADAAAYAADAGSAIAYAAYAAYADYSAAYIAAADAVVDAADALDAEREHQIKDFLAVLSE